MKTVKEMIEALIDGKILVNKSNQHIGLCDNGFIRIYNGGEWGRRYDNIINFRPENWDVVMSDCKFKVGDKVKIKGYKLICAITEINDFEYILSDIETTYIKYIVVGFESLELVVDDKSPHPHCAIMAEYAEVAKTTDKPWEEFEVYTNAYNGTDNNGWANLRCHPAWNVEYKYRRKAVAAEPKFIEINGHFVLEPERESLNIGDKYYVLSLDSFADCPYFVVSKWNNDDTDRKWLANGLIHKSQESANLHSLALLSFTKL